MWLKNKYVALWYLPLDSSVLFYHNPLIISPNCLFLWIISFCACVAHATLSSARAPKLTNRFIMVLNWTLQRFNCVTYCLYRLPIYIYIYAYKNLTVFLKYIFIVNNFYSFLPSQSYYFITFIIINNIVIYFPLYTLISFNLISLIVCFI